MSITYWPSSKTRTGFSEVFDSTPRFQVALFERGDSVTRFHGAQPMRKWDDGNCCPRLCTGPITADSVRLSIALTLPARWAHAMLTRGGSVLLWQFADYGLMQRGNFGHAAYRGLGEIFAIGATLASVRTLRFA